MAWHVIAWYGEEEEREGRADLIPHPPGSALVGREKSLGRGMGGYSTVASRATAAAGFFCFSCSCSGLHTGANYLGWASSELHGGRIEAEVGGRRGPGTSSGAVTMPATLAAVLGRLEADTRICTWLEVLSYPGG